MKAFLKFRHFGDLTRPNPKDFLDLLYFIFRFHCRLSIDIGGQMF